MIGYNYRHHFLNIQNHATYSFPILKEVFAMLAKIIGNVNFYLLCTPLKGMRFRSKRYLVGSVVDFPERLYKTSRRPFLAVSISCLI